MKSNNLMFRAWDVIECRMYDICSLDNTGSYERVWEVREDKKGSPYNPNCVIMEYIGLKDKNGKEIFEGDIVSLSNKRYEITWNDRTGSWNVGGMFSINTNQPFSVRSSDLEIVGNIFENPELLNMKYLLLSSNYTYDLSIEVQEYLNKGWELYGFPIVEERGIYQAILKKENKD